MTISLHHLQLRIRRKRRKIVGRGNASGHGTYSGRGIKGQHARSGRSHVPGFEGGRSSIIVQTPKVRGKGFKPQAQAPKVIAVRALNRFKDGEVVTIKALRASGLADSNMVKILANGSLQRKLTVQGVAVSAKAREEIEKAGGTVSL